MKAASAPMTMLDVELMLVESARLSNHRRFVIAGSLAAIGAVMTPPARMVMSRDLDLYPQLDPGRGFKEIAEHLGEGSKFHREHGFFVDPISPKLLALPSGWDLRMAPVSLRGGVVAMFLDPNDVAVSKLVRGHENDIEWVKAGLQEGILDVSLMAARAASVESIDAGESKQLRARIEALALDAPPPGNPISP